MAAYVVRIDADVTPYGTAFRDRRVFVDIGNDLPDHDVTTLIGDEVHARGVGAVLGTGADYVSGIGHGRYGSFIGSDGRPAWDPGSDLTKLAGAIVHLLSCQTGGGLGLRMVAAGPWPLVTGQRDR